MRYLITNTWLKNVTRITRSTVIRAIAQRKVLHLLEHHLRTSIRIYIYIFLPCFFPLLFSNREKSHQYLVAFLFYLTRKQGSKLWLRMGGVTPNPQSQNGSLWRPPPVDPPAKVLSLVNEVRLDSGVVVDDTCAAV